MNLFDINMATMLIVLVAGHLFTGILIIAYTAQHERSKAEYVPAFKTAATGLLGLAWAQVNNPQPGSGRFCKFPAIYWVALELIASMMLKGCYTPKIRRAYVSLLVGCIVVFVSTAVFGLSENIRITFVSSITAILMAFPVYRLLADRKASILRRERSGEESCRGGLRGAESALWPLRPAAMGSEK